MTGEQRSPMDALREAMPTDPREWWTGEEVGQFLEAWDRAGLPALLLGDASGEVVTVWTEDLHEAARKLGLPVYSADGIEIKQGAYTVWVAQYEKETINGNA